jgi:parallel beta-helix repeat protein
MEDSPKHPVSPACNKGIARLGAIAIVVLLAGAANAAVLKVPADYPTIQGAVNAASAGDVVWVAQGTYKENLTLKPKVRLEGGWSSNYSGRNWTTWPSVIDGDQKGSVIVGADAATLDGFTLRNGQATNGGGLYLERATMTIVNNTIEDNTATSGGGGIYISGHPKAPPYTDIENNVIRRNKVTSDKGGTGGGILVTRSEAGIRINNNMIGGGPGEGNTARWGGGGIYVEFTPIFQIEKNKINQNSVEKGHGGAVFITDGSPNATLGQNQIKFNSVTSGNFGGGIYSIGGTFIFRNDIGMNSVFNSPSWGGGIAVDSPNGTPPRLENNFVYGNLADQGGGIFLRRGQNVIFMNNSVAGNQPDKPNAGAGLYVASGATCILQNTILWGNGDDFREEVAGACTLDHNDIEDGDGAGQNGNISTNPLFKASDDLHLAGASPAIDAGNSAAAPKIDFDGQTRTAKVDIGADEVITEGGTPCPFVKSAEASYLEPHVGAVRAFRDQWLASSAAGKAIVQAYYTNAPAISARMDDEPWMRLATRLAVTPLVFAIVYPLRALVATVLLLLLLHAYVRVARRDLRGSNRKGARS